MNKQELVEKLADIEHTRWASWQKYLYSKCTKNKDESLTIPKELVAHWEKQINTEYKNLPEHSKQSDRDEVYKYLDFVITDVLNSVSQFNSEYLELEETTGMIMAKKQLKALTKFLYNIDI